MRRDDLRKAAGCPEIGLPTQLVAGLTMAGFRIVPEDLWDQLADKLSQVGGGDSFGDNIAGFSVERNHLRSESHDVWQAYGLTRSYEPQTWVVPCDELMDDGELVSITRLMFVGSEDELRKCVASFLAT